MDQSNPHFPEESLERLIKSVDGLVYYAFAKFPFFAGVMQCSSGKCKL